MLDPVVEMEAAGMTTRKLRYDDQCLTSEMGASAESDYSKDYGTDNELMRLHLLYRCLYRRLYRRPFSAHFLGFIETTGPGGYLNH